MLDIVITIMQYLVIALLALIAVLLPGHVRSMQHEDASTSDEHHVARS